MSTFSAALRAHALPLRRPRDLAPLIEQLSTRRIVMLGESTHGTHEFYEWRRIVSEWLVSRHGFNLIAVEGDWPPFMQLNRYVRDELPGTARDALAAFRRWPTWMWANTETIRLVEWLRTHNRIAAGKAPTEIHGLDVYSLFESMDTVLAQLDRIHPFLARRVRKHYECFGKFDRDEKAYARSLIAYPEGCEREVLESLREILGARMGNAHGGDGLAAMDARQNARIVANAENYYRTMMHGTEDSWNVRDRHMLETLESLLERRGPDGKAIIWAHNTHIGDYRATPMEANGQINLGGLAREAWGERDVALVGFGTYEGTVIASHSWGGPIQRVRLPAAESGSLEAALHETCLSLECPGVILTSLGQAGPSALDDRIRHRAIGAVYDSHYERHGNYVPTQLARRYDAYLHLDRTTALHPLGLEADPGELPLTWPRGL